MAIKQIAVFVENHTGSLAEITDLLAAANIDIRALSISETPDFGILRMIVNKLDAATDALRKSGCVYSVNEVVGVEVPDTAGSISKVIRLLSDNGVNIEYTYAFVGNTGKDAWVVLRVADNKKAEKLLTSSGCRVFTDNDIMTL